MLDFLGMVLDQTTMELENFLLDYFIDSLEIVRRTEDLLEDEVFETKEVRELVLIRWLCCLLAYGRNRYSQSLQNLLQKVD